MTLAHSEGRGGGGRVDFAVGYVFMVYLFGLRGLRVARAAAILVSCFMHAPRKVGNACALSLTLSSRSGVGRRGRFELLQVLSHVDHVERI